MGVSFEEVPAEHVSYVTRRPGRVSVRGPADARLGALPGGGCCRGRRCGKSKWMTHTNPGLEAAVSEMRTADAVAVIGAGASFLAGMPLAGQLAPLVWH